MKLTRLIVAACAVLFAAAGAAEAQTWSVRSPHGRTALELRATAEGGLEYRVHLRAGGTRTVVQWSKLGIVTSFHNTFELRTPVVSDMTRTISFVSAETTQAEDIYTMTTGKRVANESAYAQLALTFRDDETQRVLRIDARAYDEGVGFRYALPETHPQHHWLVSENTEFNLGAHGVHWGQAYDFFTMYHPSYETFYSDRPLGTATPADAGTGWGFPSLFQVNGAWVLLHESGLDSSFQGSHLQREAPTGIYRIAPPMAEEALGFGANFPTSTLPWVTPWRFFIVSNDIGDIVESNLVFHLAPPSRVPDTSWIRPGVASWNWLSEHASGLDQAKLRGFIDLAAEMGWPYTLIDANWNLSGENAMENLVAYANEREVGLLFWYNSGGRHNVVTEQPRNLMDDRMTRRAEFARLEALGVRGVKVDFFQSDKQDIIRHYIEIMEDAAEFHLMTDFHGSTVPRGWERTYPNHMSMEAVRGAEFYSFPSEPDYGRGAPRQNTILPFTRNVIGSMDYTPVHFSQFHVRRVTTNAHEAALAVVFESGLQHMSDNVAAYRALPNDWRTYLREVPSAWDDTRFIAGAPGEHVVLARRIGARWYIAGINGENEAKTLRLNLSGIEGLGARATILFDDGQGGFGSRQETLSRRPTQTIAPYGGFVMIVDR